MSNTDQAKSKLLNSMRMSKQGPAAVSQETAPAKKVHQPVNKPASTAKKPASTAKKPKTTTSAAPKKPITDNFQAAQRVWPD